MLQGVDVGEVHPEIAEADVRLVDLQVAPGVACAHADSQVVLQHVAEGGADFDIVAGGCHSVREYEAVVVVPVDSPASGTSDHPGSLLSE